MQKKVEFPKELLEEADLKEDNVVPFRVLPGGKDGEGNWLINLDRGTIFLSRNNNDFGFVLMECLILNKTDNYVLLKINVYTEGNNNSVVFWVDPIAFCSKHKLLEILRTPEIEGEGDDQVK